jgi:hypothetical protein
LWNDTRFSGSMIYGSGLRSGFANTDHLPAYNQVNMDVTISTSWRQTSRPRCASMS